VIDYWAVAGNWTHQWETLRNLARLLRRLGDNEPATLLDAAADQAPDAPAGNRFPGTEPPAALVTPIPSRGTVLEVARRAIERNLTRS
jgi:hypothetical protein